MNKTVELLKGARALIAAPGGWTQGYYARNKKGAETESFSKTAVCFCSVGAIRKASGSLNIHGRYAAERLFLRAVQTDHIPLWNDAPERTQAEVVAAFDKAIEIAEALPDESGSL